MAGMQKYMMYIVPFFSLTGLYWQYGLVLYWVTTNLWTLGQQYFMFRNWEVVSPQAAGATAAATGGAKPSAAARTTASSARPATGATRPAGTTRPASATRPAGAAKTTPSTGTGNGRPPSAAPRPKTASASAAASPAAGRVRTGSAARDAAANASGPPNGQNGAPKRSLLRLGRQKEEPIPEPEVPATKVVRQQPVRQNRSKRSGKR
jgi:YidC/Oxa1 family membrane protein insertase